VTTYSHCLYCGKEKTIPKTPRKASALRAKPSKSKAYVDPLVYEQDPYCSRTCCEVDLAEKATGEEAA
jgi:hypothetical protein